MKAGLQTLGRIVLIALIMIPFTALPAVLVEDGVSDYRIYHAPDAPDSVVRAAQEMQRVIELATGAQLPVVTAVERPMIALGDTPEAREIGIAQQSLPMEGFVIRSVGPDIFIVGRDVPPGQERWSHHTSDGTWYGAVTFLEDVVGARWLLPGPAGEDIPKSRRLAVDTLDVVRQPRIPFRTLNYIYNTRSATAWARRGSGPDPSVVEWIERNKLHPHNRRLAFGHAWHNHPPLEVLRQHPEFMRMREDGTRDPVPDKADRANRFCLSQPGLFNAYAASLIKNFAEEPMRLHGSMSSSDGYTGCDCPECKAMTVRGSEWNEFGGYGESIAPLMLRFYTEVARIVGGKFPDRIVGGHIYRNYLYPGGPPPASPIENLHLQIAILNAYGYKLFKPERAAELKPMVSHWRKVAGHLGFSDYSTWMRNGYGVPLPPGRDILRQLFAVIAEARPSLVIYTGHEAWGAGAFHNYVVGRLLWDPEADVDAICQEFLTRAYGSGAAPHVDRIYQLLEEEMARYIRSFGNRPRDPSYNVDYQFMSRVCAPLLAEIEQLYLQALASDLTSPQQKRLEMLGDNLAVMHFNLRKAELAGETPQTSPFYKSDEEYIEFLRQRHDSVVLDMASKLGPNGTLNVLSPPDGRRAVVPRLMSGFQPPVVDGVLNDPAWEEAVEISGFRTRNQRSPALVQTAVKLAYDERAFYIGIECADPNPAAIPASSTERDSSAIFEDDTVEIFLAHPKDPKRSYWHLAFNAVGGFFDAVASNSAQNLDLEYAAHKTENGWAVEIAIPFSSLGMKTPEKGTTWRINFARSRKGPPAESSSWNGVERGFHEPHNFGTVEFAGGD